MATTVVTGVQYSGIWTMQQVNAAIAAGTWPVPLPALYGWGYNNNGQAGINSTTATSAPTLVGYSNWSKISSHGGGLFCMATKTDGTLWSWGANGSGQLGLGNTTYRSSPTQVGSLTSWLKISAGYAHSLSVKTDGSLWVWGRNNIGQLGLGNTTNYSSPKQLGALTNWYDVSAGYYFSLAIKTDGTLWSWGYNAVGSLGLGNTTYYSSPKQIGALTTWLKVTAGYASSYALKTDGTLWAWGKNSDGQLGIGNTTYYSSPKQVGALTNWLNTSAGTYANRGYVIATKTDGTLWGWGRNQGYGSLGLGNKTNYSSPKQIGGLTTWLKVSAGYASSFSIKTDGTLWAWGYGGFGSLGDGTTVSKSSPVQIGSKTDWVEVAAGNYPGIAIANS